MRTVHWKLFARDDGKTTGVLPKKKSKPINQEPQSKTDFEKLMTKFLDGQRVANMFFKNNVNDIILKMRQDEKNFQIKIKMMERKIDEWLKSQNVSSEQTDRTDPSPPQAQTDQVNVVFTESGKSDDSLKTQKDPPPPIIVDNKTKKDKPIKTSKKGYYVFCRLFWINGIGWKLYEWAGNLVAPELVLDHHLLDRNELHYVIEQSSYENFVETLLYERESLTMEDVLATLNSRELRKVLKATNKGRTINSIAFLCHTYGHLKRDCPMKEVQVGSTRRVNVIRIMKSSDDEGNAYFGEALVVVENDEINLIGNRKSSDLTYDT
ncbi:hypothetical protein Tco_1050417 [Tanacetum coccineum]